MFRHEMNTRRSVSLAVVCFLALMIVVPSAVAENNTKPQDRIAAFGELVYNAWRAGEPMPQLSIPHPDASLEEAYGVQQHFVNRIMESDEIGGFKAAGVANPSPDFPMIAVMPASGVLNAADNIVIDLSEDPSRHVENEIGYVFGRAVTTPIGTIELLKGYVSAILPIVEVPGNPVEKTQPDTTNDMVAWNCNAKDMILGAHHDPAAIDPDAIEITMTRDCEEINEARGDMAAGGQWHTLLKTVNHIVRQGYTIQPGHVITNGAVGNIVKAEPGRYHANYGPLGIIEFQVR